MYNIQGGRYDRKKAAWRGEGRGGASTGTADQGRAPAGAARRSRPPVCRSEEGRGRRRFYRCREPLGAARADDGLVGGRRISVAGRGLHRPAARFQRTADRASGRDLRDPHRGREHDRRRHLPRRYRGRRPGPRAGQRQHHSRAARRRVHGEALSDQRWRGVAAGRKSRLCRHADCRTGRAFEVWGVITRSIRML